MCLTDDIVNQKTRNRELNEYLSQEKEEAGAGADPDEYNEYMDYLTILLINYESWDI